MRCGNEISIAKASSEISSNALLTSYPGIATNL